MCAAGGVCCVECVVLSARRIALITAHAAFYTLSGGGQGSSTAENLAVTGKRCPPHHV